MKNKKNNSKKIIISIAIIIFCILSAPKTFALKRAIFPDEKSLQPIPVDVKPNISGNINSTIGTSPTTQIETPAENQEINIKNSLIKDETNNKRNWKFYVVLFSSIFLIILFIIFFYKRLRQS